MTRNSKNFESSLFKKKEKTEKRKRKEKKRKEKKEKKKKCVLFCVLTLTDQALTFFFHF